MLILLLLFVVVVMLMVKIIMKVVDRSVMDYLVMPRDVAGSLVDVSVFRGKSEGISDNCLTEGKLRVGMKGKKS